MTDPHPLEEAIALVGLQPMAAALGVTYNALRKWEKHGRMPRTEWTGETNYAETIERLTGGKVTKKRLHHAWPDWEPKRRSSSLCTPSPVGIDHRAEAA